MNFFTQGLGAARRLLCPRHPTNVRLVENHGLWLLLEPTSYVDHELIQTGNWESAQQDYFLSSSRRLISQLECHAVFIDVGAYFGLYAMRMAKSDIFNRIIAIEADRRNYAQLRANIFINSLDRKIECVEAAANECRMEMLFWCSETHNLGNRAGVGLVGADHTIGRTEKVRAVPIDDILSLQGALVVGKIDVEGHELSVIRGMKKTIENNNVLLQVECFPDQIAAHDEALASIGLRFVHRIGSDSYWTNIAEPLE